VVGIIQVGRQAHADRYTYLPQIGVYLAITWLVAQWRMNRAVLGSLMSGVVAVLMVCAWKQAAYWKDSETLWTHTIDCTSGNGVAHYNLGIALDRQERLDEAIEHYQKALQIIPDSRPRNTALATISAKRAGWMKQLSISKGRCN
jgi:tetratricopeptide (TPR) repeat protein